MKDVDMLADRVADLAARARTATPAEQVTFLAEAADLAVDPLQQIELLLLLADASGRAAHAAAGRALHGEGRPEGTAASWVQIGDAAGLSPSTAFRQWHHGQALGWSTAARGVRQAPPRTPGQGMTR